MRNKLFLLLLVLALSISACGKTNEAVQIDSTATPLLNFSTPTLAATITPQSTNTPRPPTLTPTYAPISASLTAQINLRAAPSVESESLGMLNFGTEVFIIGKSADKEWIALLEPMPGVALGWASVKFVSISDGVIDDLRVIDDPKPAQGSNPSLTNPQQTAIPNSATTTAELNVRSGPASTYDHIATIPANTAVTIIGKNQTEIWTLVSLPLVDGGAGWVASRYLEGGNYAVLPYYDDQGNLIDGQNISTPSTNPSVGAAVTPTIPSGFAPAANDNDTFDSPLVNAKFGPTGDKELQIHNNVSSPTGDREDWIKVTPYQAEGAQATLIAAIQCTGNGAITIQLYRENTNQWEDLPLTCGVYDFAIKGIGSSALTLHIVADGSAGDVRLVDYTLTIRSE